VCIRTRTRGAVYRTSASSRLLRVRYGTYDVWGIQLKDRCIFISCCSYVRRQLLRTYTFGNPRQFLDVIYYFTHGSTEASTLSSEVSYDSIRLVFTSTRREASRGHFFLFKLLLFFGARWRTLPGPWLMLHTYVASGTFRWESW
jgi:hypothetical protein